MGKQLIKSEHATCPHCLEQHALKELEKRTEYGCWGSEEETVECPDCEESFQVRCTNRGFEPDFGHFDFDSWCKTWGILIPKERIFVEHYLLRMMEEGELRLIAMVGEHEDSNPSWAEAFEIAKGIWAEFLQKKEAKELA